VRWTMRASLAVRSRLMVRHALRSRRRNSEGRH
jgi:N-acetylglucosaminyl-diphospho-decaprenol L-rhamnosyltransferase